MGATISGQTVVTTAGTAVRLNADKIVNGPVMVKALTTNTGLGYVGAVADDVAAANGMPLAAGDTVAFYNVTNLNQIWLDVAVSGEGFAWLILGC
jgi:hypothetical protein